MSKLVLVIGQEWKQFRKSTAALISSSVLLVLLLLSGYLGHLEKQAIDRQAKEASAHIRQQWDNQGAGNPHGAAHLGTYVFKPTGAMAGFDEGVEEVTGRALFLEGHRQNEIQFSTGAQSLSGSPFGKLKPSLLLQLVVPLLLIFMVYSSLNQERKADRIRIILSQSGSFRVWFVGKILFFWCMGVVLLLITLAVPLISEGAGDELGRALLIGVVYALYYWIICSLTAVLTLKFPQPAHALSTMLVLWILWGLLLPKLAGSIAGYLNPLPSRQELTEAMKTDRAEGIDGHNPDSEKLELLKDSIMAHYQVREIKDLPINFDGLLMQADEEFGNTVWDIHFGKLYKQMEQQKLAVQMSGLINPFQSLKTLSIGLSGTDLSHHLSYMDQAENYRRGFIRLLNEKHAYGGSKTGDWDWEAEADFYSGMADFTYQPMSLSQIFRYTAPALATLLLWFGLSILFIFLTKYHL